jgi:hypothetical protein
MAIAFDVSSKDNGNSITSIDWSHTCTGSNRVLIVFVNKLSAAISGVTYNGVSLANLWDYDGTGNDNSAWYLINPPTGAHTVEITFSSSLTGVVTAAASYTGVHQTTAFGTVATAQAYNTTPSVNVSSATGEVVIDACGTGSTLAAAEGQTERFNSNYFSVRLAGSDKPGASSVTMSWTKDGGSGWWAMGGVSLKPASDGGLALPIIQNYNNCMRH